MIALIERAAEGCWTTERHAWLLEVTEALLCVPLRLPEHRWERNLAITHGRSHAFRPLLDRLQTAPDAWTDDQLRRIWGLARWFADVADPATLDDCSEHDETREHRSARIPRRLGLHVVDLMHRRGVATDADVLDELVGPRTLSPSWRELAWTSGLTRQYEWQPRYSDEVRALALKARDRVVEIELGRGEAPTRATRAVNALTHTGGLSVCLRALSALRRDAFQRGYAWHDWSRRATFSEMVRATVPGEGETPEAFAALAKELGLSRERLLQLATYAPQWSAHVEVALRRPGLADAVWWVHAHTKDQQWTVTRRSATCGATRSAAARSSATRTSRRAPSTSDGSRMCARRSVRRASRRCSPRRSTRRVDRGTSGPSSSPARSMAGRRSRNCARPSSIAATRIRCARSGCARSRPAAPPPICASATT